MSSIMSRTGRTATRGGAAILMAICALALAAGTASAAKVYKNLPHGSAGKDTESECMNGCGHTSFGVEVTLAGRDRYITSVTGEISSFSCEFGIYSDNTCETEAGATFTEPVTLKIYEPLLNEPGALLYETTVGFPIAYKPEPNVHGCVNHGEGTGWGPACHIGDLTPVKFENLPSVFATSGSAILELAVPEDESTSPSKLNKSGDPHSVNVATATPFNGISYTYEPIPAPTKGSDPDGGEVIFGTMAHPNGEAVASTEEAPGSVPAFEVVAVKR